jgi:hypothetical protein
VRLEFLPARRFGLLLQRWPLPCIVIGLVALPLVVCLRRWQTTKTKAPQARNLSPAEFAEGNTQRQHQAQNHPPQRQLRTG